MLPIRRSTQWLFLVLVGFGVFFAVIGIRTLRRVAWVPAVRGGDWWPADAVFVLEIPRFSHFFMSLTTTASMQEILHRPELAHRWRSYQRQRQARILASLPASVQDSLRRWIHHPALQRVDRLGFAVWFHRRPTSCPSDPRMLDWAFVAEAPPEAHSALQSVLSVWWSQIARALRRSEGPHAHTEGTYLWVTSARGWQDLQDVRTGRRAALRTRSIARRWEKMVDSNGFYAFLDTAALHTCGWLPAASPWSSVDAILYHWVRRGNWLDTTVIWIPPANRSTPWQHLIYTRRTPHDFVRWVDVRDGIVLYLHLPADFHRSEWMQRFQRSLSGSPLWEWLRNWNGRALLAIDLSPVWRGLPELIPKEPATSPWQAFARGLERIQQIRLFLMIGTQNAASWKDAWLRSVRAHEARSLWWTLRARKDLPIPAYELSLLVAPGIRPVFGLHDDRLILAWNAEQLIERWHGDRARMIQQVEQQWRTLDTYGSDRWFFFAYMNGPTTLAVDQWKMWLMQDRPDPEMSTWAPIWRELLSAAERWKGRLSKAWCTREACTLQSRTDVVIVEPLPLVWLEATEWLVQLTRNPPSSQ